MEAIERITKLDLKFATERGGEEVDEERGEEEEEVKERGTGV